jgi:uncharacterized repeat protein (TIGR01451 family)
MNMKVISRFRILVVLVLGLIAVCPRAGAQTTNLFFEVIPSTTNAIPVNGSLTYSIFVTNTAGFDVNNVFITNAFSRSVQFLEATNDHSGEIVTNGNTLTFQTFQISPGFPVVRIRLTIRPTTEGFLTNTITLFALQLAQTNITIPVVHSVTNLPLSEADLAVAMSGPTLGVLVNDLVTYNISVSNLSSATITNVVLSNTVPAGVIVRHASPTNQSKVGSALVFNLGTLTNLAVRNFKVTIVPTNSGPLTFSATIGSTNIADLNSTNNLASLDIEVQPLVTGELIATNLTESMVFNPQHSLMEQTIRLVNIGSNTVDSARVFVTGLTNWLYNAVGTNTFGTNGINPYVIYGAPLESGESVDLLLEYVIPSRTSVHVDNTNYVAVGVALVDLTAPTNSAMDVLIRNLTDGGKLIEFSAIKGRTYTILYSSDVAFATNALAAQPSIVAQANRVQWIDDGPPKTVSHPSNPGSRYYKVLLNP